MNNNAFLNGWRRLGIVLCVCWVVAHLVWAAVHYFISVHGDYTHSFYTWYEKELDAYLELWYWRGILSLVIPPVVWGVIELSVISYRWISCGFRPRVLQEGGDKK